MTPNEARETLARLASSGNRVRIGYTLGSKSDKLVPMSAEDALYAVNTLESVAAMQNASVSISVFRLEA